MEQGVARHEQGGKHKEAIRNFLKDSRDAKYKKERDDRETAKEMRAIEQVRQCARTLPSCSGLTASRGLA